jgi:hypothetical protein
MNLAFTIATANYLSQAKALSDSFLKYNPQDQFKIILLDKIENRFDINYFAPAEIIEVEMLGILELDEMVRKYTVFELSNALKPFVADYFLSNEKVNFITYLDSDILVFNNFSYIYNLLKNKSIIISSHSFSSIPDDGLSCNDKSFLLHGIYNGGFFAVRNDAPALVFIKWWKQKLKKECLVDYSQGLYVDQKWLNFVPLFFKGVSVTTHLGINVGYWNLHERKVDRIHNSLLINKVDDLIFFHFSGFDLNRPDLISKHQNRFNFLNRPDLKDIFKIYFELVKDNSFHLFSLLSCFYYPVISLEKRNHSRLQKDKSFLRKKVNQLL